MTMIKTSAILVLSTLLATVSFSAMAQDNASQHRKIRDQNARSLKWHADEIPHVQEANVRYEAQLTCRKLRPDLDLATCNRIAGIDRWFDRPAVRKE
jgi:hypothetical protein